MVQESSPDVTAVIPAEVSMKNDENSSVRDDTHEVTSDLSQPSGFNLLNLNMSSLKARIECSGLFVETEQDSKLWNERQVSDISDGPATPFCHPDCLVQSPPSSRKILRIDESKTPRAALSMGEKDGEDDVPADFEILPDETDEDDEELESVDDIIFHGSMEELDEPEINENESPIDIELLSTKRDLVAPVSPTKSVDTEKELNDRGERSSQTPTRRRFLFAPKSPRSQNSGIGSRLSASALPDSVEDNLVVPTEREKPKRGQRLTTMIRKIGGARKDNQKPELQGVSQDIALVDSALEEQDSSSDESSFDDDENWSDDESQIFDEDLDETIDCSDLVSSLPNSFLDLPPDMYDYLDTDLVKGIKNQDVVTFAKEHHHFVKGLLQLLAERDLIGVEDDVLGTHNISKMGVLRKKDGKIGWRVKYVEVRKGNLTYFADKKEREKGRTVHLRKRICYCRELSSKEGGHDFNFELIVDGGRRLLWTAQSEEECRGWVRAINHAMIGEVDDSRDVPLDVALYQNAIDDFQAVQSSLKEASSRQEYLVAMNRLLYRQTSTSALRVPMKWIRDTYLDEHSVEEPMNDHERIKFTVRQFWKNLCNNSVVLNGHLVEADGIYSGERVIGALSRCILEFDKVEDTKDFDQIFNSLKRSRAVNHSITELEAVAYARNILNGALMSMSRGDIETAVRELFRNDNVAFTKLESSEPLHVYVSYAGDDFSESRPRRTENVGWIETKSKKSKKWKMRYFVVSEAVLSFFERAEPRPHRLVGQMVLRNAKVSTLEGNVLSIEVQNQERLLRFDDRGDLIRWKAIIDDKERKVEMNELDFEKLEEILVCASNEEPINEAPIKEDDLSALNSRSICTLLDENIGKGRKGVGAKFLQKAARAKIGMQRAKNATGAKMKSIRTGAGMLIRGVRWNSNSQGMIGRRDANDLLITSTRNLNVLTEKREPTVQAVVEMNSTFQVISKKRLHADDTKDEIFLTVRVKLYQAFLLSGGPHGRLACGDELLLMEFSAGKGADDVQDYVFFQAPTSL